MDKITFTETKTDITPSEVIIKSDSRYKDEIHFEKIDNEFIIFVYHDSSGFSVVVNKEELINNLNRL